MYGSTNKIKRVAWVLGPDGNSEALDVNSDSDWIDFPDGTSRPVLNVTVTKKQPAPQPQLPKPPIRLRPRPTSRAERERLLKQEEKGGTKESGNVAQSAWSYNQIMECCGRF